MRDVVGPNAFRPRSVAVVFGNWRREGVREELGLSWAMNGVREG